MATRGMDHKTLQAALTRVAHEPDASPLKSLRGDSHASPVQNLETSTVDLPPPRLYELPQLRNTRETPATEEFSVVRVLGTGGMGSVALATQRSMRRRVAVKTALDANQSSESVLHEGVITGMLEHPNIPPIHSVGIDDNGHALLVMKHIEGVTWSSVIHDEEHPFRKTSLLFANGMMLGHLEILMQVCNAVELAHSRGVIHRDIKPENVMLGSFGEVYLIDWGVAFLPKWHPKGALLRMAGTPVYMPPESVAEEVPDARTDIYLLGATLHEVLMGKPPHASTSIPAALTHAFESAPIAYPESVPSDLAALCNRAMSRERVDRPQSVQEFRAALRAHIVHRESMELTRDANARLVELEASLSNPDPSSGSVDRQRYECLYGYSQALRAWPDNLEAQAGRMKAYALLARKEVEMDNPRGARAYLTEGGLVDPALEQLVKELEAKHHARVEAERERLERERQMDLRNAARERMVATIGFVLVTGLLMVWRVLQPAQEGQLIVRHNTLLASGIASVIVGSVGFWVLRKRLLVHTVNRAWISVWLVVSTSVVVNRIGGRIQLPGAAVTLSQDLVVAGAVVALASRWIIPQIAWALLPLALGYVAMFLAPAHVGLVFNTSMLVAAGTLLGVTSRAIRKQKVNRARGTEPGTNVVTE